MIYLASKSPRRRDLLRQIGVKFQLLVMRETGSRGADVDETPRPGEAPGDYVERLACVKAEIALRIVALRGLPGKPVLAADTTVTVGGDILGKPADDAEAESMLAQLSGRTHQVLTGVAAGRGDRILHRVSVSTVEFKRLSDAEIRAYVRTGEPRDKAGAYAIQGRAALFVRALSGSYSGIVGLPLFETGEMLRELGGL